MSSPAAKPPDATIVVVREELERLLEGRELRNSQQLRKLLRFLVEETLAGRSHTLKEYRLGLEVFQRGSDFVSMMAYGPNTGLPSFPWLAKRSISSRRLLTWSTDGQRRRLDGVGSERTADRSVRGEYRIRHRPGPEGIAGVSAGSVP